MNFTHFESCGWANSSLVRVNLILAEYNQVQILIRLIYSFFLLIDPGQIGGHHWRRSAADERDGDEATKLQL